MSQPQREQWSSRTGFLLAAVGSAVGLGNMWRFSYLTAESGGGAFVLLYILMTLAVGLPVMLVELMIGRGAGRSPVEALGYFGGRAWQLLGALFVLSGFLILAYYSVIAGWTVRYLLEALVGGFRADPAAYFGSIINGWNAVVWHVVFMAITVGTVVAGVKAGIERLAVVLMPLLFLVVCGLAVYAATLDGAATGYRFYLSVDWSEVLDTNVLNNAASQAFFSLSLGMGAIMTYASYLPEDSHLPNHAFAIGASDFGVAFIAGLAIFPMLFAFDLQGEIGESTIGTLFIVLPRAFVEMGAVGTVVGLLFFFALVIGALTSAISLLEVVVASAMDHLGWTRVRAALVGGGAIAALGVLPAFRDDMIDLLDLLAGQFLLIAGGLLLCVFAGWVMRDPIKQARKGGEAWPGYRAWLWVLRIPVPALLAFVLFFVGRSLLEMLGDMIAGT